ncbi:hypothetical protein ABBQ38_002639 [Trebouxia sp. C0009 RCD-2024]
MPCTDAAVLPEGSVTEDPATDASGSISSINACTDSHSTSQQEDAPEVEDCEMTSADATLEDLLPFLDHLGTCATRLAGMILSGRRSIASSSHNVCLSSILSCNPALACQDPGHMVQELQALQQDVGTANTAAAASAAEMQNYKAESGQRMEDLLHDQAKLQQNYDQALEHCQSLLADMHSNLSKLGVITAEAAPSIAGQAGLVEVVKALDSMLEAMLEHLQQVKSDHKAEMQAANDLHASALQGREEQYHAAITQIRDQHNMVVNQLDTIKYANQQRPQGLERVFNYCHDTGSSPHNTSPAVVKELLDSHVVAPANELGRYLQKHHNTVFTKAVATMLPADRKAILGNVKAGPESKRCCRSEFVSLVLVHLSKALWGTSTLWDNGIDTFISKQQIGDKLVRLLAGVPLLSVNAQTLDVINRYLLSFTKDCMYWQGKCKDNATLFADCVKPLASELAIDKLPQGLACDNKNCL